MKKIAIFIVIAFASQMFCENVFGQTQTASEYKIRYNNADVSWIGYDATSGWNSSQYAYFKTYNGELRLKQILEESTDFTLELSSITNTSKITAPEILKLEANNLELNNNSLSFTADGMQGLKIVKGTYFGGSQNEDFSLYFQLPNWNRIITEGAFSFTTGGRGKTNSSTDLFIQSNGNVGIGTSNPSEKLTVSGNLKLGNGGHLINDNELGFVVNGVNGLQMKKGKNDDFTLLFPIYGRSTRFVTGNAGSFSFATGGARGISDDNIDLHINSYGRVGIGTLAPSEKLTINGSTKIENGKLFVNVNNSEINNELLQKFSIFAQGGILSEDYAIAPQSAWADHVFNTDYKLQNLKEVENFIQTNKHLPGIPSASEVQENGYTLHDMNVKLLQKVEELTLYSIEQNKKIEQLEDVVKSYQTLLEKVEQLENKIK